MRKRVIVTALTTLIFAGAGFAYYAFIGCQSGTCPLTSSPISSTLYGGVMGVLLGLLVTNRRK